MQGSVGSHPLRIRPNAESITLECGNPLWVAFDLLSLCYLPPLRNRVFFLREVQHAYV